MQGWQSTYLGAREVPRELSSFELQTFFTYSRAEHELIGILPPVLLRHLAAFGPQPHGDVTRANRHNQRRPIYESTRFHSVVARRHG